MITRILSILQTLNLVFDLPVLYWMMFLFIKIQFNILILIYVYFTVYLVNNEEIYTKY